MIIQIICYEDIDRWILGKFAVKLKHFLEKMGNQVTIGKEPNPDADINYHIIYLDYGTIITKSDVLMITHIDSQDKLSKLVKQMSFAKFGICMSRETMDMLIGFGINKSKLCFISPANDLNIKPRLIEIGIVCRVQDDGRKREYLLDILANKTDPKIFKFVIMGENWNSQVSNLKTKGFEVDYYQSFDLEIYKKILPFFDYYLYFGQDEGQIGFIDAISVGVKTIVTPQGYHLDIINGITHAFETPTDLLNVFSKIAKERQLMIDSVKEWNWENYSMKHFELWQYLLSDQSLINFRKSKRLNYTDGVMSIYCSDIEIKKINRFKLFSMLIILMKNRVRNFIFFKFK